MIGNGEGLLSTELHTFFPFDPYKLPRSSEYIQGVYREWSAVAIGADESEDEDEDEDEEGDGDGNVQGCNDTGIHPVNLVSGLQIPRASTHDCSSDADGLGESFGGMSISPAPQSVVMVA